MQTNKVENKNLAVQSFSHAKVLAGKLQHSILESHLEQLCNEISISKPLDSVCCPKCCNEFLFIIVSS